MGTIIPRKRADGTTGYSAQIVIKVKGEIVHRETKTFDRRQAAAGWLENREEELKEPGAIEALKAVDPTLGEAIARYVAESRKEIGRTKAQVLETICADSIAALKCSAVTSAAITEFARRRGATNQPQTVGNYISHLSAVFAVARPAWGFPLDEQAMKDAQAVAKRMGYTAKSASRDRLPTMDELHAILSHFEERSIRRPSSVPMVKVVVFALFSTRRLEEITRIEWSDLDEQHSRVLVRDMKHPGQKAGNDTWCDLPEPALRVALSMPRTAPQIFPFGTDAIGASFTRACHFLEIEDLHLHDLRHAGISRLAEMGWSIPHMAGVSGHRSWSSLKRYSHMKAKGDRYEGWAWIERAIGE
jgi:integrase